MKKSTKKRPRLTVYVSMHDRFVKGYCHALGVKPQDFRKNLYAAVQKACEVVSPAKITVRSAWGSPRDERTLASAWVEHGKLAAPPGANVRAVEKVARETAIAFFKPGKAKGGKAG